MNQPKEADAVLAFDLLYTTNHIQMLKAALPYAPRHIQPILAIFIKYMELAFTISCVNHPLLNQEQSTDTQFLDSDTIAKLLSSLEQYLTEDERKKLTTIKDMMKNFEQIKEMQKIMEFIHPSETTTDSILSNFLPQSEDFTKSSIDDAIAQIFSTLNT